MADAEGGALVLLALVVFVALGLVLWVGYLVVGAVFESMGRDFGSRTGIGLTFVVGGTLLGTLVLTLFSPFGTALLLGLCIGVALGAAALLMS
ncbi:MAG TPA: hypothetical protein VLI04_22630 [Nocardioidaceae bacterium]|nr:hypothetical protein [Nocardioidaceae bacterium]